MTPERQKQVLIGLLAVLAVVFAVRVVPSFTSSGGSGRPVGGLRSMPDRGGATVGEGSLVVDLKLGDLEQKPGEFKPGRDPFRFERKAPPPAPPKPPPPPPRPAPNKRPKKQPKRAAAQAKPIPPEPSFKFLGSFGPEKGRIAVFSDNADIYNVAEGDVFKEAFVVRKIGYESADIGWVNFPDEPARRLAAGG